MKVLETRDIPLDALLMDPDTQIRQKTQPKVVKRYRDAMRAGEEFPPITIVPVKDGEKVRAFTLIDGWHRTEAAKHLGKGKILAEVVDAEPHEFRWIASQKNMTHGLPLTRGEKRDVFRAYVKAMQHRTHKGRLKSAREISRDLQCQPSDKTITEWMRQDFPKVYREMNGGEPSWEQGRDRPGSDPHHQELAQEALTQFWASFRAIRSPEAREALHQQIVRIAEDVAMTVTGKRELPEILPDEF